MPMPQMLSSGLASQMRDARRSSRRSWRCLFWANLSRLISSITSVDARDHASSRTLDTATREVFARLADGSPVDIGSTSKMSKSKMNYPPPERILDQYGADALTEWYVARHQLNLDYFAGENEGGEPREQADQQ